MKIHQPRTPVCVTTTHYYQVRIATFDDMGSIESLFTGALGSEQWMAKLRSALGTSATLPDTTLGQIAFCRLLWDASKRS
jgi:hypothetical protein